LDEEDDLTQLQTVENKLLTHDPTFGIEQTHAALSSQRLVFMSAFWLQYIDALIACIVSTAETELLPEVHYNALREISM
jgi:hypothetical protein